MLRKDRCQGNANWVAGWRRRLAGAVLAAMFAGIFAPAGTAETAETATNLSAAAVMERVLAHRAQKDLSLKARLFVTRDRPVELDLLVRNTPEATRTIYRVGQTELLTVQPVAGEPRWFLKGAGELTGAQRLEKLAGSQFTYYDLALPFLHWPEKKLLGTDRFRGRNCYLLELSTTGEPYRRARLWVDQEFFGLVRAELYDGNDALVRRMMITSFKRVGEIWIPRGIEIAFVPPRQALPAEEKSRLEIYDGNYDATLPAEWFDPSRFAVDSAR